jgi:hypothetical protein
MDGGFQRIARAVARRHVAGVAAMLLAFGAAACTTDGQPGPVAATPRGPTVAFESIDGPPESIFHKLVQNLSAEAEARQMAVVSREAAAHYRIKAYLATIVDPKRSVVAWVWDVYDADQRRAFRIAGEEPVTGAGRTTWAAAEDHVLRRIARTGMDRLVAFLAAPRAPGASPPAEERGVTMAAVAER